MVRFIYKFLIFHYRFVTFSLGSYSLTTIYHEIKMKRFIAVYEERKLKTEMVAHVF